MLRPGGVIVCCSLALLCLGVVMVNSAAMEMAALGLGPDVTVDSILLSRSSVYMVLAMLALGAVALSPFRRVASSLARPPVSNPAPQRDGLGGLALATLLILAVLLAVYIPGLSREVNGARRWLGIGVPGIGLVSVQPSEIAKWAMLGIVAWYVARRAALMHRFWLGLVPILAASGLVILVILREDLGTGVLLAAATGLVLLAGGARLWHLLLPVPVAAAAVVGAIALEPYRLQRLRTFMDPYLDPQGAGYHMIQSMATVAGGGGWGRGLGNGLQKFGYLPEDTTDFLYAIICEELGVMGAAVIAILYLTLLWAGVCIIRREREPVLKLLGVGILATVGLQALINMLVVTGWAPTKGIPLPLVSSGGTGWILTAASLGILVAIDRTQHTLPFDLAEPEPPATPIPA